MVTVVIEEVGDTDSSMLSVAPSSILESDDPSSLLYLLDTAQEDQLDALLEDDVFATAMGQRMLAVSGHEVDDSLLSLGQLLLSRHLLPASKHFALSTRADSLHTVNVARHTCYHNSAIGICRRSTPRIMSFLVAT